jgi:hypothetical protein
MQHDQSKGAPAGAQQSFAEAELENLLKNREYLHLNLPSVLDNSKFREPLEFNEDKDKREKVFDKFYTGRIQIRGLEDRDCPLDVDILIPKSIVDVKDERTHPVHVRFHGGGFVRCYTQFCVVKIADTVIVYWCAFIQAVVPVLHPRPLSGHGGSYAIAPLPKNARVHGFSNFMGR